MTLTLNARSYWKTLSGKLRAKRIPILVQRSDRLADRANIRVLIDTISKDGIVGLVTGGTDCDGYKWEGVSTIPANVMSYIRACQNLDKSADGPSYCYMIPLGEALSTDD